MLIFQSGDDVDVKILLPRDFDSLFLPCQWGGSVVFKSISQLGAQANDRSRRLEVLDGLARALQ